MRKNRRLKGGHCPAACALVDIGRRVKPLRKIIRRYKHEQKTV
jgi:hypothetical protein